jgi:hypothetical protein
MKRKSLLNDSISRIKHLHCDLSDHGAMCLINAIEGIIENFQEIRSMETLRELLASGIIDAETFKIMAAQYERTIAFLEVNKLIIKLQKEAL